jgi:hypothetical protein
VLPAIVAQGSAKRRDVHPETAFVHDNAGPDPGHQRVLADDLTGMRDQFDQDVERAAAKTNRFVVIQ